MYIIIIYSYIIIIIIPKHENHSSRLNSRTGIVDMTTPPTLHSKLITVSQWKHSYIIIYKKFISYTAFIGYLLLVLLSQVKVEYTDETPQQFVSEMNEFI